MHKLALALALLASSFVSSCTISARTVGTPEPKAFLTLSPATATRDTVLIALGAPQGTGLRRVGDVDQELMAFNSFKGELYFSGEMAAGELLCAIAAVDGEGRVPYLFGWQFGGLGEEGRTAPRVNFSQLMKGLEVGRTTRAQVADAIDGWTGYRGVRVDAEHNVALDIQSYTIVERDMNQVRLQPRRLVLGFDKSGVLRDVLWWSSNKVDFETGAITPNSTTTLSELDSSWPFPYVRLNAVSVSSQIDVERVEALLRTKPTKVEQFEAIIGTPSARGARVFMGEEALELACWEHQSAASLGIETKTTQLPGASVHSGPGAAATAGTKSTSVNLMDVKDTRLMVFSKRDGTIAEIVWIRPRTKDGA